MIDDVHLEFLYERNKILTPICTCQEVYYYPQPDDMNGYIFVPFSLNMWGLGLKKLKNTDVMS